tara:strand:- start:85 stop:1110 length:1026 start_codon:yes stop_codon:yes gene_type:complete
MAYTTINKSSSFMNTLLYTGNSSTQSITGVGFSPSFSWLKKRTATEGHNLFDTVRGATKSIMTSSTNAEATEADKLTAFDADGFSLGSNSETNGAFDFVSWNWKAGTTSGITTDGNTTITPSSYSFNQTSGISILKFTSIGSASKVAHGLGKKPQFIITKRLDSTSSWLCYHEALDATDFIKLHDTAGTEDNDTVWGDTEPDTVNFTIGSALAAGTWIAICFTGIDGYSKFSSYKGNNAGSNGIFCYTGFAPQLVIQKLSSSSGANWYLRDVKRDTFNPKDKTLRANTTGAEDNAEVIDFYSNGFKTKSNGLNQQDSGETYIYMAWGQSIVGTNNIPATGR